MPVDKQPVQVAMYPQNPLYLQQQQTSPGKTSINQKSNCHNLTHTNSVTLRLSSSRIFFTVCLSILSMTVNFLFRTWVEPSTVTQWPFRLPMITQTIMSRNGSPVRIGSLVSALSDSQGWVELLREQCKSDVLNLGVHNFLLPLPAARSMNVLMVLSYTVWVHRS